MSIKDLLEKNSIPYQLSGNEIITHCVLCKQVDPRGDLVLTLHVDQTSEDGECMHCKKRLSPDELLERFGGNKTEEEKPKKKRTKQTKERPPVQRIAAIEPPKSNTSFDSWRNTITMHFPDLLFPSEVGLSVISQLLIKDITNPFALVLVDVPSAGKTITINFFADIKNLTYASDKFTPAAFISSAANVKKEKLQDIDLLPRLQYKMFLIRDLATLFSKRDEDLSECIGTLTRVLDGEGLAVDTGVHGKREYTGEYLFMVLAASTPIPPRVWKIMGNLGSRLFFLTMNTKDKTEQELSEQLATLAYKEREKECRGVTKEFLYSLWNKYPEGVVWNKNEDEQEYRRIIARSAKLLARLRGVINVWKERNSQGDEYSFFTPVIEKPDRINQLFYNLCRGHALVCARTQINSDDLRLIVELAIDSAPTMRARLLRILLDNDGSMQTTDVETALNCSKPTALKEMETLKILEICTIKRGVFQGSMKEEKTVELAEDLQWFLSDECRKIRGLPVKDKENTTADLFN